MFRKSFLSKVTVVIFVLLMSNIVFATQNTQIIPGSQGEDMNFENLTRGLYYNGTDFYLILD